MMDDQSPLVRDIFISDAVIPDMMEDTLSDVDLSDTEVLMTDTAMVCPFDIFSLNYMKEEEMIETMFIDQCLSNGSFDLPQTPSVPSSSSSVHSDFQSPMTPNCSLPISFHYHPCLSISFSNPPDPIYHVRYLSEITNIPLDGNVVHTKKKTKKNTSGRYLKGIHGRHVTIDLPANLSDHNAYYIRVTRLTVPYQSCSFIHPYPLLYSKPKKKTDSIVEPYGSSFYYKLSKEEICCRSKQFPNIILTRVKQCELKKIKTLTAFDNNAITCPFEGDSPKQKIAAYQLKKSQLDFRLVMKVPHSPEFIDLNASCRSNELLEEEGTECKKLPISLSA